MTSSQLAGQKSESCAQSATPLSRACKNSLGPGGDGLPDKVLMSAVATERIGSATVSRETTRACGRLLVDVTFRTDDPVAVLGQAAYEEGATEARQASPRRRGVREDGRAGRQGQNAIWAKGKKLSPRFLTGSKESCEGESSERLREILSACLTSWMTSTSCSN